MRTRTDQQNKFPFAVANDFDQDLMDYVEALKVVVDKWWKTRMRGLVKRELTTDVQDPYQSAFTELDKQMGAVYTQQGVRADVNKMARLVVTKAHSDLKAEINNYVGYDPMLSNKKSKELAQKTIDEAVGYVKSIPQEYHREVKRVIYEGMRKGKTINEVAGDLNHIYQTKAASRTRVIAQDQVGNLRGAITKAQHQSLGLESFEWTDVGDDRVRPRHVAFSGQVFTWAEGASGEYPGSAICCRCTASTVKSEVIEVMGR